MNKKKFKTIIILIMGFIGIIYFPGCTIKKGGLEPNPMEPAFALEEYQEAIRQGDDFFSQMHLYGWRQADEYYRKAYDMKKTQELRDKRFLALCLIAVREKHEKIVNPQVYEKIATLGEFPKNQKQQYLADIVRHYRDLPVIRKNDQRIAAKERKEVDITAFDLENSPLDTYLYLFCLNYYTYDSGVYNEELVRLLKEHRIIELMENYSLSPLFIYNNYKKIGAQEAEIEEKYPQFAEFLVYKANRLFSQNKLKQASHYYRKALALIPGYTNAINGIGNIYYFTVKDFETAITYYQQTLDLDSLNPVALFGKGVSLHYLGKYTESNEVLDFMLANQEMYHGEAYHYKAYNWYRLKDPVKAREFIDQAKLLMPRYGEVFFLSGLLYYNEAKKKEAEADFLHALYDEQYSHCYPLYYLGMVKIENQDWSFIRDFTDAVQCFETAVLRMNRRQQEIDDLEIEDSLKEWMKKQLAADLQEFKTASDQVSQQMKAIIAKNIDKKKAYDKERRDGALQRVKTLLEKNPGQLNEKNPQYDGGTLLHEAVQKGQYNVVKLLLSRGAQWNIKDNNGYTPLHWAVLLGAADIARLLISHGADIRQPGPNNMTLLHDAVYNGNTEIVKMLLLKGAKLDAKDQLGNTPLRLAIEKQNWEIVALLKPLHLAVEKGNLTEFKQVLNRYTHQVDTKDEKGRTPLHLAAFKGYREIAWELINQGADVNARDTDGYTPRELAGQQGHQQMVQLLQSKGAVPGNNEILAQEFREKQAVIWYLGGNGWAVKTKNHFLIFDYQPPTYLLKRSPTTPLLANGQINPSELQQENIFAFLTHEVLDAGSSGIQTILANSMKQVTYISHDFARKGQFIKINHHEKLTVAGMEIVAFASPNQPERTGFYLKVDGLVIFYPGNQGYWSPSVWQEFHQQIEYLRTNAHTGEETPVPGIDIAFLPVPGMGIQQEQKESEKQEIEIEIPKEMLSLIKHLEPRLLFPITTECDESEAISFKAAAAKKVPAVTQILCPEQRGDRFSFEK